ncbi:DUF2536 family protein [Paenibacillus sp. FSL K6-4396]|uniref:DUF2536 family protein n=1 Tax=unclassified Paenibacillus TaxID=185978 RepID=UPI001784F4AD|nr:DUF2536 family protein [Paenibacillus sp. CFBP 13594]MBD8841616.1 DUF2536 family protein [Paenibacillus sp. CFBP 13594]
MEISLDMIKDKVECLQAYDFHELARVIEDRIEINKALMLRVKQVQHQVTFDPIRTKMLYSAVVHFAVD